MSRSLSRLFDPVNLMFSAGEVPTEAELHQVFKGVSSEVGVAAAVDARLAAAVCRNVAKTVRLTCVKGEQMLVTDGEASQVVGYPTEGQVRNANMGYRRTCAFIFSFQLGHKDTPFLNHLYCPSRSATFQS